MSRRCRRICKLALELGPTDADIPDESGENDLSEKMYDYDNFSDNKSVSYHADSGSEYLPSIETSRNSLDSSNLQSSLNSTGPSYSSSFEAVRSQIEVNSPEHMAIPVIDPSGPEVVESVSNQENIKSPEKRETKRRIRRKHHCQYCEQSVFNYARHMERQHADELQVQQFLSLDPKSEKRKKLIDKLRREGDFYATEVIPVMEGTSKNLIICKFCRGYYSAKTLRRHIKRCFFNPDPTKKIYAQREGHTLMHAPFGRYDLLKTSGLLNMMNPDSISTIAKRDEIICEVARRYLKKHKDAHLMIVAKRCMRRLARLLQCVRELDQKDTLKMIDILCPQKFQIIVRSTKIISGHDEKEKTFKSPTLALQMGTLIKHAADAAYSLEIQREKPKPSTLEKLSTFKALIDSDWAFEVSSEAGQNLTNKKFNKSSVIPAAEDIKKFENYLSELADDSKASLEKNSNDQKAFRSLLEATFCSVLLFNRRRVGELQRLALNSYLKNSEISSEFEKILTSTEKILMKSLKRVVVKGKRGRGVPVLFNKKHVENIEILIAYRKNFISTDNVYLFASWESNKPITGYQVMRKHSRMAFGNNSKAMLLTSTRLRKHLATITQIFNMEKTELEQLACFMGHTEKTHAEFYRLPDDVYQTAKISKLLVLSQESDLEKYKGKSLKDIDLGDDLIEDVPEEECFDSEILSLGEREEEEEGEERPETSTVARKNIKRTVIPWTAKQKQVTKKFFSKHIIQKVAPKKREVTELVSKHPSLFNNKTWKQIKAYVYNQFKDN